MEEENDKKEHQNINNEITNLTTSNRGFEIPAGLSTITEGFREMAKLVVNTPEFIESMRETFTALHRNISALLIGTIKTSEWFSEFTEKIAQIVRDISFPGVSEIKKKALIDSYDAWGKYGWTINPCEGFESLLNTIPESKEEADKKALTACKNMDSLIEKIRVCKRVKKSDFEEAVSDFELKHYKSCALVLISLIDSRLIRLQGKSGNKEKGQRACGKGAVDRAREKSGLDKIEMSLLPYLFYVNYFSCLHEMFKNGGDFRTQPDVPNRNFLCHGMLTRKVRRKDCIQLFLLYYNTLVFLDMIK